MSDKSEKRSISFSPGSLYTWAKQHGEGLPSTKTVSAVICTAVSEYKERIEPQNGKVSQLLAAAKRVGLDAALDVLATHQASRRRRAGR